MRLVLTVVMELPDDKDAIEDLNEKLENEDFYVVDQDTSVVNIDLVKDKVISVIESELQYDKYPIAVASSVITVVGQ